MNGPHVHVEVAVEKNGSYWLLDPIPALRAAMGGVALPPPGPTYAERISIPQPDEEPPTMLVRVIAGPVPVRQYASPDAPKVRADLEAGEDFRAKHMVYGADGRWWFVSTNRGRVALTGLSWPAETGIEREGG